MMAEAGESVNAGAAGSAWRLHRGGVVVKSPAVPIYEYECEKCGRAFEYMQSMSEPAKTKCEKCGGKLSKLLSAAGFVLKGGGWYKDLYGSAKPDGGGSDKGGDSSDGSASSSSEGESSLGRKAAPAGKSGKPAAGKKAAPASKAKGKSSGKRA